MMRLASAVRVEPTMVTTNQKAPHLAGLFIDCCAAQVSPAQMPDSGGFERLDASGQTAFVAGSLVLVNQAACAETVEDRLGNREGGLRAGGVVGVDRLQHFLDGGAKHGTLGGITRIAHDGLFGALFGGLDVGHGWNPE